MQLDNSQVLLAFSLTLFAGLATGIGSVISLFAKRTNKNILCLALGFSAGVMIYVSFVEILPKAAAAFTDSLGDLKSGNVFAVISFFGGIIVMGLLDFMVPEAENPHESRAVEDMQHLKQKFNRRDAADCSSDSDAEGVGGTVSDHKLLRIGFFSAAAIAVHNFPEGLATFTAGLKSISLGLPIAIAIAIHNIPEGIAVAVPVYYATGSRKKAFVYSFLSGMAEPLGALISYMFLAFFFNDLVFGVVFAGVAGMMVYISLDELLPAAHRYGKSHVALFGLVGGMFIMAASLLLFA